MNSRILFCTFVYDWYQSFIPSYIYSILKSYPQYACRILVREALEPGVREALKIVRDAVDGHFEVVERCMPHLAQRGMEMRWLLGEEHFAGYDYGWIGDVDFLHIREEPAFLEQEMLRAGAIGMPYANVVRGPPAPEGLMSGLHFIVVKPYFARMQPIIAATLRRLPCGPLAEHNESLLYQMVKQGCGVLEADEPRPYCWQKHHGLHLGIFRIGKTPLPWVSNDKPLWSAIGAVLDDPVIASIVPHLHPRAAQCVRAAQAYFSGIRA